MGTRSNIAILREDNTVEAIYFYWDGYLSHNGVVLRDRYDRNKTKELMKLGDLSFLDKTLDTCIAYGRDKGEQDTESVVYSKLEYYVEDSFNNVSYTYLLDLDDVWKVYDGDYEKKFISIDEALEKDI